MRKQEKTVLIVALVDCLSITVKFLLAVFTGSLSIYADAWHSIGDLATSVMVFLALVFDRRERASESSVDSGKVKIIRRSSWEPRVCAIIGLALVGVAAGIFRKVLTGGELISIRYPVPATLVVLFLILLSYIRFHFEESVGRETGSPALIADAYHSKVDIYALSLVLISLFSEMIQLRIDRWIAGLIAIMILTIALKTIYNAFSMMLRSSHATEPKKRTVEDVIIMLTMGYLFFGKKHLMSWISGSSGSETDFGTAIRRVIFRWGPVLALLLWLSTGLFIVGSRDSAIVERFGKPVMNSGHVGPGIHYDWPWPVSVIRRVDLTTVRWMRLGYQTKERKDRILWTNAHYTREYSVLTGDGAIVALAADLHYSVKDPIAFLYSAANPEDKLLMISDEALRKIAGKRPLFDVLAHERTEAEAEAAELIQILSDSANLGFHVLQICFLDVHPPMEVASSFEDVVSAQEDLETYVEQARGYYGERIPLARAEAFTQLKNAEIYRYTAVQHAQGRSRAYILASTAFKIHESVNRHRKRMESLETWLSGKTLWLIDPSVSRAMPDFFISRSDPEVVGMQSIQGGDY